MIMKIIPTYPRTSLMRFHLNGSSGSHALGYIGIIFIILALSHVLSTLIRFSLGNSRCFFF